MRGLLFLIAMISMNMVINAITILNQQRLFSFEEPHKKFEATEQALRQALRELDSGKTTDKYGGHPLNT